MIYIYLISKITIYFFYLIYLFLKKKGEYTICKLKKNNNKSNMNIFFVIYFYNIILRKR